MSASDSPSPTPPTQPQEAPSSGGHPRTAVSAPAPFAYRDRWALVTGASSGIGEVFARELAARGMHVVLCARSADRLVELARELQRAHGVQAHVVPADLARPGAAAHAWADASAGREIHLLVNNAGFGLHGRFDLLPRERQAEMVALNCTALLELAHLALTDMVPRRRGAVINVGSLVAFQPVPFMATYAATKAFVLSLSESLSNEFRESGVRILALCPGPTPTGFQAVAGTRVKEGQPGYLTAEAVVRAGLAALEAGRSHVVPGLFNRVGATVTRMLPLAAAARLARRVNERRLRQR